jgi:hypothetical protein
VLTNGGVRGLVVVSRPVAAVPRRGGTAGIPGARLAAALVDQEFGLAAARGADGEHPQLGRRRRRGQPRRPGHPGAESGLPRGSRSLGLGYSFLTQRSLVARTWRVCGAIIAIWFAAVLFAQAGEGVVELHALA